jgi:hypothetical protein
VLPRRSAARPPSHAPLLPQGHTPRPQRTARAFRPRFPGCGTSRPRSPRPQFTGLAGQLEVAPRRSMTQFQQGAAWSRQTRRDRRVSQQAPRHLPGGAARPASKYLPALITDHSADPTPPLGPGRERPRLTSSVWRCGTAMAEDRDRWLRILDSAQPRDSQTGLQARLVGLTNLIHQVPHRPGADFFQSCSSARLPVTC